MKNIGRWRWLFVVLFPAVMVATLVASGQVKVLYKGQAVLDSTGSAENITADLKSFHDVPGQSVLMGLTPNAPSQIQLRYEATSPRMVVERLEAVAQACVAKSLQLRRDTLKKESNVLEKKAGLLRNRFDELSAARQKLIRGAIGQSPKGALLVKIEDLKLRRRQLIESYPTHSDISVLARQIQGLLQKVGGRPPQVLKELEGVDKELVETQLRLDYSVRRIKEMADEAKALKPEWRVQRPIVKPSKPSRVEGWPMGVAGLVLGVLVAVLGFRSKTRGTTATAKDGLWIPEQSAAVPEPHIELEVITPEAGTLVAAQESPVSSDPLTEKAASLYVRWIEVAKLLYTPSVTPPEAVLDSVTPLLQESAEFLPEGHDVMARYLAKTVEPGNLPAHVARTVLMTLTSAEEAKVTAEHRLAMALAALFHDLSVVPRSVQQQEDVGSEVGRLSAVLLRRIPGLGPALLSMVEDILIGMDEFKLDTWQNVSQGRTLEPLSKVLREIDRFEKVLQKQKTRLLRASNS